jgi:hypothetical protein
LIARTEPEVQFKGLSVKARLTVLHG